MLSKLVSAAKNSKIFSIAQELSFKDKVDVFVTSVVVGVSIYCFYNAGKDYYEFANYKWDEIEKKN